MPTKQTKAFFFNELEDGDASWTNVGSNFTFEALETGSVFLKCGVRCCFVMRVATRKLWDGDCFGFSGVIWRGQTWASSVASRSREEAGKGTGEIRSVMDALLCKGVGGGHGSFET